MIEPKEFEKCFCAWVEAVCQKTKGEIVSIDGKTIRKSGGKDWNPVHMVSAWANHQQIVQGQLATDEKSNEITAVPALLEMLDVAGCIITADSMSCQKEIMKVITEKKADYVLGLKNDQPTMHTEVKEYFDAALKDPRNYPLVQSARTRDFGHGRIVKPGPII